MGQGLACLDPGLVVRTFFPSVCLGAVSAAGPLGLFWGDSGQRPPYRRPTDSGGYSGVSERQQTAAASGDARDVPQDQKGESVAMADASRDTKIHPLCNAWYGEKGPAFTAVFWPAFRSGLGAKRDKYATLLNHLDGVDWWTEEGRPCCV